jgi:hypothetical protein
MNRFKIGAMVLCRNNVSLKERNYYQLSLNTKYLLHTVLNIEKNSYLAIICDDGLERFIISSNFIPAKKSEIVLDTINTSREKLIERIKQNFPLLEVNI